eukprot:Skav215971  [mRNA]  locus=scaffold3174:31633:36537:- [translate_table: standard]
MQFTPNWRQIAGETEPSVVTDQPQGWMDVVVISANVLALDPATDNPLGRMAATRTLRLDAQWHDQKVAIAGVQEARTAEGRYTSQNYVIFSSGADLHGSPSLGCELWLHKTLPFWTDDRGYVFAWQHCQPAVLHSDPRRLLVLLTWPGFKLCLSVLHAPYIGGSHTADAVHQWWQETADLVASHSSVPHIACTDANAPLGQETSESVGSHGAEDSRPATQPFVDLLLKLHWWVPATFQQCHTGPTWTWTHPRGTRMRRDYVLLSKDFAHWQVHSWTMVDHDTTFAHDDHLPAAVKLVGPFQLLAPPDVTDIRWDRKALKDPLKQAQFQEAVLTLPLPTWDVKPDDHCRLWEQQLRQLGQQFFAPGPGKTKKLRLPEPARNLIAFKRQVLDFARAHDSVQHAEFKSILKDLEALIRPHVRRAQAQFYDELVTSAHDDAGRPDSKELFKALTRLGRQSSRRSGARPLPALQAPDGTLAKSFEQQQTIWFDQFARIEAGYKVTWDALRELNGTGPTLPLAELEPTLFPSDWSLQRGLRRVKSGRVPGPNHLPPELLQAAGPAFPRQMAILTLKIVAAAKEPLHWKGGRTCPLYKGSGSPQRPDSYRSIFISDYTAKLYHHALRVHLAAAWERRITALQCGGRQGYATDIAHHYLQVHQSWCHGQGLQQAVIFFDVKSAFYAVFREAIVTAPLDPDRLPFALAKHGLLPPRLEDMVQALQQDAASLQLSTHLDAILRDMLYNTHFRLPGVQHPCLTNRGTRPGDPVGDILFNLVMVHILQDMRHTTLSNLDIAWVGDGAPHGDFSAYKDLPRFAFAELAFVDDCAVMLHAPNNIQLQAAVAQITAAFVQAAAKRGLEVNWKEGKTELLWHPTGTGSRQIRRDFAANGAFVHASPTEPSPTLRVVNAYKHLGTWLQTRHRHSRELRARVSAASAGWGPLAKSFFRRPAVPQATKTLVFQMISCARHLYHAHIWTGVQTPELEKWADALRPMLASLVRGPLQGLAPYLFSVDELAGLANLLPPIQALHLARLRYLKRLLKVCPSALWTMLQQDESDCGWLALCRQSLVWLCQHYDYPLPLKADAPFLDWIQFVQLDFNWHGRLKTAAAACRQFFRAKAEHHCHVALFEREFVNMGAQLPAADTSTQTLPWECGLCGARFATSRGLAIHAHKKHGYRDKVRYYALGTQCLACNLQFHTRPRLCRHLQVQERCMATYQACFAPAPEELVDDLDRQDRELHRVLRQQGWTEFHALQACLRLPGPVLPDAGTPEAAHMLHLSRQRLDNQQPAYTQMFGICTSSSPVSSSQLWWQDADLPAFVFQSAGGMQRGDGRLDMGGLAKQYAILHIKCLVFVHFFSGYRRDGDLHTILDQQSLESGVQLFTLSVDLCMQRQRGDLARPAAYKWWRSRALSGQLMGCGGGPPCETYTAARWNDNTGPRPLRDRACPCGRYALSNKEWKQLAIGSQLMHFMLMMTLVMIQTGGCCFVEHPQWPLWLDLPKVASIWGSRQMRLLRTVASVAVTSFDQCVFKATAKKPTTILTVRLQRFRCCALKTGWGGRCPHAAGFHRALKGRTDTGAFRTAEHKVYPEELNRALGSAIHHFAQTLAAEGDHERVLPTAFEPFVAQIFATMEHVQPDYHGSA